MNDPSHANGDSPERRAIERMKWIRDFCIAHHSQESAGVHLHHLTIDLPQYLDEVIAALERKPVDERSRAAHVT